MKITDQIAEGWRRLIAPRYRTLRDYSVVGGSAFSCERRNFASLIWYNICDLLTDICENVKIEPDAESVKGDAFYLFAAFRQFVYTWGKIVLQRLYDDGRVVIGWDGIRFWLMSDREYSVTTTIEREDIVPHKDGVEVYVMKSATWLLKGSSDRDVCRPWLDFLDDVCNASATIAKRLGVVVLASPKNLSSAPMATVLTKEQKEELEKQMREDYGALSRQSQIMLLPREMSWQTINLAGLDVRTLEKAKLCITAIADRIKVPANQIAIIDSESSKTLSNGGELREGDKAKYKSFRRLFERTFVQMAMDLGIKMTYTIDGEPIDEVAADLLKG